VREEGVPVFPGRRSPGLGPDSSDTVSSQGEPPGSAGLVKPSDDAANNRLSWAIDGKGTEMEREHGGPVIEAVTRFIVDKYETSYGDGFIIVNMWDENGRAYVASIRTEDALRMATYIRDVSVDELEGEAAEGAL
jgi:hypothetical protein